MRQASQEPKPVRSNGREVLGWVCLHVLGMGYVQILLIARVGPVGVFGDAVGA